jgi:hypothetical protein
MTSGEDAFDEFVRTLSSCTPSMIVEGLAAALDTDDLEKLAAELDELILHLTKSRLTAVGVRITRRGEIAILTGEND